MGKETDVDCVYILPWGGVDVTPSSAGQGSNVTPISVGGGYFAGTLKQVSPHFQSYRN